VPKRSHHIACVTDDRAGVVRFLTDIIGLEVTGELHAPGDSTSAILGWPPNDGADGTMLGQGPGGLVEVIQIPADLEGKVEPGFALISFAMPDLEARVEDCRARGIEVSDVIHTEGLDLSGAVAHVGGLGFELLRFGSS
jgi:catechol 2,3-dioxygenase-like lactoylglutathione lyase family enzyme